MNAAEGTRDGARRVKAFVIATVSLTLLLAAGFSVLFVIACCIALIAGYFAALFMAENSRGESLWSLFEFLLNEPLSTPSLSTSPNASLPPSSTDNRKAPPWEDVLVPEAVNKSVEELIEQLIDSYINSWYKSEISNDTAFVNEIRYQIRYASALAYRKIIALDFSSVILSEAVPIAVFHAVRVHQLGAHIDRHVCPPQMVEQKVLEAMEDVHYALGSRQNEVNYLRQVADHLLSRLLDESRLAGRSCDHDFPLHGAHSSLELTWPSHPCRHFLRELIVYAFLLPLLDLIADPDTINRLLILLFDPEPMNVGSQDEPVMVPLLYGLTNSAMCDTPDSLLHVKLSEILRDSRQLQMFTMYLKDVRGPTNELYFLLHSGDVHERMLSVQKDNENALSELHYEIWQVFSKYVHEAAPERVALPLKLFDDFQVAVESRQIDLLDVCVEKAYQLVYKRLQQDFVVPFCQSECYLGHLCGSPPVSVDELMTVEERSNLARRMTLSASETSFSLSQFRSRLWKVITPSSTDGSIDSSYDRLLDVAAPPSSAPLPIEVANEAAFVSGSISSPVFSNDFSQLPTIDVTCENEGCNDEPGADICDLSDGINSVGAWEECGETISRSCSPSEMAIFDPQRDINRWIINIPHIEPRRDPSNGRTMYVYIISVERFDLNDELAPSDGSLSSSFLNKWSVVRRYNEFYVLESKLLEFHGDLIKSEPLPPRKPFSNKSRAFIEAQRPLFERFIQLLARQSVLKRSDLLFMFLTSGQELKDTIQFSDLNPWNVVRKMPGRFARERGQNLKPYLLSLLSHILAAQPDGGSDGGGRLGERSEASSLSSFCMEGSGRVRQLGSSAIFGNNCPTAKPNVAESSRYVFWTRSLFDSLFFLVLFISSLPSWLACLLCSLRCFAQSSLDAVITLLLRRILRIALHEENCVRIVRLIQDAIFAPDAAPCTEQEKSLRAELAQRRTLEYLQEELPTHFLKALGQKRFRQGVNTIFQTLQCPRLNKQLSYVLLDVLVEKLLPVEDTS